jgi:putative transposase
MQNGLTESFNGRMRDELLNETLFIGVDHARQTISQWVLITIPSALIQRSDSPRQSPMPLLSSQPPIARCYRAPGGVKPAEALLANDESSGARHTRYRDER